MLEALAGGAQGSGSGPAPGAGTWASLTTGAVSYLGTMEAVGGSLFLLGGRLPSAPTNAIRKYNITTKAWSTPATLPAVVENSASAVLNDLIYNYSGATSSTAFNGNLISYNPANNQVAQLAAGVSCSSSSLVAMDGKLYAFGGQPTSTTSINTLRRYDPTTNSWTTLAPSSQVPIARYAHKAVAVGNKMYVIGGLTTGSSQASSMQIYDLLTDTWTPPIDLGFSLRAFSIGVIGRHIYISGGVNESAAYLSTTRVYDVDTGKWTLANSQFKKIGYQQAAVSNGLWYVFGGYENAGTTYNAVGDQIVYTPS